MGDRLEHLESPVGHLRDEGDYEGWVRHGSWSQEVYSLTGETEITL